MHEQLWLVPIELSDKDVWHGVMKMHVDSLPLPFPSPPPHPCLSSLSISLSLSWMKERKQKKH